MRKRKGIGRGEELENEEYWKARVQTKARGTYMMRETMVNGQDPLLTGSTPRRCKRMGYHKSMRLKLSTDHGLFDPCQRSTGTLDRDVSLAPKRDH